ncbi:retropepsin-like aspartic protease family protein [Methylobacterium nodulans]|uniref:Putative protease n=1 Tax=Methylobacterium nodulans (strain LMG 21967 / CNCM I-2342 / ORS 2060) TaxID=460265 RepID=B8IFN6_METNO|nr:TIGR02281 family clan AA aspartic protease [Methylobacterium nodulans]ACL57771.1 putative protease [Methylobacterium nodulans ORS 2060]
MTRPLHWALGVLALSACFGSGTVERVAAGLRERQAPAVAATSGTSEAPVVTLQQDWSGHYSVHPLVEGRRLRMMVDTGATLCAFTQEDAERAGLRVSERDFRRPMSTANGVVYAAPVRIGEMQVGGITIRGVEAVVLPRGRLGTSLLGMSFLRRLRSFEAAGGRLTLRG